MRHPRQGFCRGLNVGRAYQMRDNVQPHTTGNSRKSVNAIAVVLHPVDEVHEGLQHSTVMAAWGSPGFEESLVSRWASKLAGVTPQSAASYASGPKQPVVHYAAAASPPPMQQSMHHPPPQPHHQAITSTPSWQLGTATQAQLQAMHAPQPTAVRALPCQAAAIGWQGAEHPQAPLACPALPDPMTTMLNILAQTNDLLRRESSARTLGLRSLLDLIYDHMDAFEEAAERVMAGNPERAAKRAAALQGARAAVAVAGPGARLWVEPAAANPAHAPSACSASGLRLASFNVSGLDHRDSWGANQTFNVAQTIHIAQPDILAVQDLKFSSTAHKLAALLNLWVDTNTPHAGTWQAFVQVSEHSAQGSDKPPQRGEEAAPRLFAHKMQAILWRERPGELVLARDSLGRALCAQSLFDNNGKPNAVQAMAHHTRGICCLFNRRNAQPLLFGTVLSTEPGNSPPQGALSALERCAAGQAAQPCTLVLASSREVATPGQDEAPTIPHTSYGLTAELGESMSPGLQPLLPPDVSTLAYQQGHADDLWIARTGGYQADSGKAGAMGTQHVLAPGRCSHHRLVWADVLPVQHAAAGPENRMAQAPRPLLVRETAARRSIDVGSTADQPQRGLPGRQPAPIQADAPQTAKFPPLAGPAPKALVPLQSSTYAEAVAKSGATSGGKTSSSGYGLDAELGATSAAPADRPQIRPVSPGPAMRAPPAPRSAGSALAKSWL